MFPSGERLVTAAFTQNFAGLPRDFDAAYWNAAPADQQVAFLAGDETLELHNLCATDAPGARRTQLLVPSSVIADGLFSSSTDAFGETSRRTP